MKTPLTLLGLSRCAAAVWLGLITIGVTAVIMVAMTESLDGATIADRAAVVCVATAHCGLAVAGTVLAAVDVRERRLPNVIMLPLLLGTCAAFMAAALLVGDFPRVGHALIGALVLGGSYFALAVAVPGGMGFGDVKLATVVGIFLGWHGLAAFVIGATAPFILGGLWAGVLIVAKRVDRQSAIPFGPWMLLGAWLGIWAGVVAAPR